MGRHKKVTNTNTIVEAEKPLQENVMVEAEKPTLQHVLVRMLNENARVKEADIHFSQVEYLKSLGWKEI